MVVKEISVTTGGYTFDGYTSGPESGALVLCLHGFPQFADSWLKVLPRLGAAGFRAVALNQRGYSKGAQPTAVADYALPILVEDVLNFANALGADKFHLVGHDWGGIVAWKLAADFPERLLSVNVVSTPHLDAFREALVTSFDQVKKSSYIALFKAPFHLAEKALKADNWKTLRKAYQGKVEASQVEKNIVRLSEGGTLTFTLNWYRALSFGLKYGLIKVPALYIWGSADQALGERAAVATGKFVKAAYRFERIPEGSHWLLDESPEMLSQILVNHIGKQQK